MSAPTPLPLPLRNALAHLTIAALDDDDAAAAVDWLAAPVGPPAPTPAGRLVAVHLIDPGDDALLEVHAPHAETVRSHAARAHRAVAVWRATASPADVDVIRRATLQAAALWNEHLFFEVHEVLEAVWKDADGPLRHALQGVIQIGVAFHHLAHGNVRGARTLLSEGRARLAACPPATLPAIDVADLLDATTPWLEALTAGRALPAAVPPRLATRSAGV
jgi:hypothetical protein